MPKCIGMLGGSEHVLKMFCSSLGKEGVEMLPLELLSVQDVIEALTSDIDAVFITDRACAGAIGGREDVLKKLRDADATVRIIFCFNTLKKDEEFENWCDCRRISDVLYPKSDKGDFAIPALAKCVKKGRLKPIDDDDQGLPQNVQPRSAGFFRNANALIDRMKQPKSKAERVEVPVERVVEVEKRIEVPVERVVEVERRVEVPVERIVEVEKRVEVPVGMQSTVIVGVYNICRGAGATTMAAELAKDAGGRGLNVYLIAADGSDDLAYVKHKNIRVSVDTNLDAVLMNAMCSGAHLVLIDFGLLLEVDKHGETDMELSSKRKLFELVGNCNMRIAMCHSAEWHMAKLAPFAAGEFPRLAPTQVVLDGEPVRASRYESLNICRRNELAFSDIIDVLGFNNTKTRRRLFK